MIADALRDERDRIGVVLAHDDTLGVDDVALVLREFDAQRAWIGREAKRGQP